MTEEAFGYRSCPVPDMTWNAGKYLVHGISNRSQSYAISELYPSKIVEVITLWLYGSPLLGQNLDDADGNRRPHRMQNLQ